MLMVGMFSESTTTLEGWLEMEPAYVYSDLVQRVYKDGKTNVTTPSTWDQFAAEMDAFSEAIQQDRDVATPGEEGVRDMKILMACYESAASGRVIALGQCTLWAG